VKATPLSCLAFGGHFLLHCLLLFGSVRYQPGQVTTSIQWKLMQLKLTTWKRRGVTIHWTGLLDWTTGLTQNAVKCLFKFFSV